MVLEFLDFMKRTGKFEKLKFKILRPWEVPPCHLIKWIFFSEIAHQSTPDVNPVYLTCLFYNFAFHNDTLLTHSKYFKVDPLKLKKF